MKILKISLLSFILISIVIMAFSFSAKKFAVQAYDYNATFTMGSAATPLNDATKWDPISSLASCANGLRLCGIDVVNIPPYATLPTEQEIIDQIKAKYIANGNTFTHGEVVDILDNTSTKVAEATVSRMIF